MASAALPRAHVMRLRDAGLTMQQIADRARLPVSTLNGLLYPRADGSLQRTVHNETAQRIMSVPVPASRMDRSLKCQRQLQALACLGWTSAQLARYVSHSPQTIARVRSGNQRGRALLWTEVDGLYRRLSMRLAPPTPPGSKLRKAAQRAGWAPPLAWDEGTMGDPNARPSGIAIDRKRAA